MVSIVFSWVLWVILVNYQAGKGHGVPQICSLLGRSVVTWRPCLHKVSEVGAVLWDWASNSLHGWVSELNWTVDTQLMSENWLVSENTWRRQWHSSTFAWEMPWMEEPGGLQSMGLQRVRHNWATLLSLFTFRHRRRKWQPTPVFVPGESQGWRSLVCCCLWGRTESDTTEAT